MNITKIISDINSRIQDGISGDWEIVTFNVTKDDVYRQIVSSFSGRFVIEGKYKKLLHNGEVVMSNTPDEIRDHYSLFKNAKGDVLINGLGLGVCLVELLNNNNVNSITVIEKSEDVINLVSKSFNDDKIKIIHDDAFLWKPKQKYDSVWHDIWYYICEDNLDEMKKLHRKYGKFSSWQGSWCRGECEMLKKRNWRL